MIVYLLVAHLCGWNFRQYLFAILYLGHPLTYVQNEPLRRSVKYKTGSKIERCHVRVSHLLMTFLLHQVDVCAFTSMPYIASVPLTTPLQSSLSLSLFFVPYCLYLSVIVQSFTVLSVNVLTRLVSSPAFSALPLTSYFFHSFSDCGKESLPKSSAPYWSNPPFLIFRHSGTLALSPERQSARMSEIKNGGLDQYGPEHSKA